MGHNSEQTSISSLLKLVSPIPFQDVSNTSGQRILSQLAVSFCFLSRSIFFFFCPYFSLAKGLKDVLLHIKIVFVITGKFTKWYSKSLRISQGGREKERGKPFKVDTLSASTGGQLSVAESRSNQRRKGATTLGNPWAFPFPCVCHFLPSHVPRGLLNKSVVGIFAIGLQWYTEYLLFLKLG